MVAACRILFELLNLPPQHFRLPQLSLLPPPLPATLVYGESGESKSQQTYRSCSGGGAMSPSSCSRPSGTVPDFVGHTEAVGVATGEGGVTWSRRGRRAVTPGEWKGHRRGRRLIGGWRAHHR